MKSLEDLEKKINSELTTKLKKSAIRHNQLFIEINNEDLAKRLENLSTMYAKMNPQRAAEVLLESKNKAENLEVLKRLKPKSLGLILENMPAREAYGYVSELQK